MTELMTKEQFAKTMTTKELRKLHAQQTADEWHEKNPNGEFWINRIHAVGVGQDYYTPERFVICHKQAPQVGSSGILGFTLGRCRHCNRIYWAQGCVGTVPKNTRHCQRNTLEGFMRAVYAFEFEDKELLTAFCDIVLEPNRRAAYPNRRGHCKDYYSS